MMTGEEDENDQIQNIDHQLILNDNVPMRYKWSPRGMNNCDDIDPWTRKETSCDVEVDTIGTIMLKPTNAKVDDFLRVSSCLYISLCT